MRKLECVKEADRYDINHIFVFMVYPESRVEVFWDNLNFSISLGKYVIFDRENSLLRILYSPSDITVKLYTEITEIEMGYWFNAV